MTLSVMVSTREQPAANALINLLQDHFPVKKVIWERWGPREPDLGELISDPETARKVLGRRFQYYRHRIEDRVRDPLKRTASLQEEACDRVFGQRWRKIDNPPPSIDLDNQDWQRCAQILREDPPDVLLVFGNSLLPDYVCEVAKITALNIHTGLSPHYRGKNCTNFAIINEDFENIGVTVHVVRRQIDGGEMIGQRRPEIVTGDTEYSIEAKNQRLGHQIYVEVVERLMRGEKLAPVKQPKNSGLLLMGRAQTPGHVRLVRELIEGGAVDRYLERKAKGKTRPKQILEELAMVASSPPG